MRDPPIECRFMVDASSHGELCGLKGMGFLEVSKAFPGRRAFLPFVAQLPANGIPLLVRSTVRPHNNLVRKSDCQVIAAVVYDGIQ